MNFSYKAKLKEGVQIGLIPFNRKIAESGNYRDWFHDPDVTKFNSHGLFPYGDEAYELYLHSLEDGSKIVWAIVAILPACTSEDPADADDFSEQDEDENGLTNYVHIGNVSLQRIDWINCSAEFAIVIGEKNYWGRGIATACLQFAIAHAFHKLHLNRVWSGTSILNVGMRKVFEHASFCQEGTFRSAQYLDGSFRDIIEYGILRQEYLARQEYLDQVRALSVEKKGLVDEMKQDQRQSLPQVGLERLNTLEGIIDEITRIRGDNNTLWMGTLRLALTHCPKAARLLLQGITENDKLISELTAKLGEER